MGQMRRALGVTDMELDGVEGLMHDSPLAVRCGGGSDRARDGPVTDSAKDRSIEWRMEIGRAHV